MPLDRQPTSLPPVILRDAPARYPHPEVADPEVALRALRGSGRVSLVGRRPRRGRA